MRYRCWMVTRNDRRLAYMVGDAMSESEALKFARFHWPDAEVRPNRMSGVA